MSYMLHFPLCRSVGDIGPAYMVYMQRTKAEVNAKAFDPLHGDTDSQTTQVARSMVTP